MHNDYTHIPREVQDWQIDDYERTIWWHAVNTYGLSASDAREYVRIEKELDRLCEDPSILGRNQQRYNTLMRRHAALTSPERTARIAA